MLKSQSLDPTGTCPITKSTGGKGLQRLTFSVPSLRLRIVQTNTGIFLLKVPKTQQILLPSRALTEAAAQTSSDNTVCFILDKTHVSLPESQRSVDAESAWSTWMEQELSKKLRGLTAGTVRAQVRIVSVRSAEVRKGMIRCGQYTVGPSPVYCICIYRYYIRSTRIHLVTGT